MEAARTDREHPSMWVRLDITRDFWDGGWRPRNACRAGHLRPAVRQKGRPAAEMRCVRMRPGPQQGCLGRTRCESLIQGAPRSLRGNGRVEWWGGGRARDATGCGWVPVSSAGWFVRALGVFTKRHRFATFCRVFLQTGRLLGRRSQCTLRRLEEGDEDRPTAA